MNNYEELEAFEQWRKGPHEDGYSSADAFVAGAEWYKQKLARKEVEISGALFFSRLHSNNLEKEVKELNKEIEELRTEMCLRNML